MDPNGGIICFISNGAWLDGNSSNGLRKTLEKEFSSIYVFNLRGNQRTSGELSRKEGGKIFGSGSRTPIAITLLVKNPAVPTDRATIYYHDIGDYLSQSEKLKIVQDFGSVSNKEMSWRVLQPNKAGDWISLRNDAFASFIPIDTEKKYNSKTQSFFITYSRGNASSADAWVYNSSLYKLKENVQKTIAHYNEERVLIVGGEKSEPTRDFTKGNWTRDWLNFLKKNKAIVENRNEYRIALYRPFCKVNSYFDDDLSQERYQLTRLFPNPQLENLVICVSGVGGNKENTSLITKNLVDLNCLDAGTQCFPLYYYEENNPSQAGLFDTAAEEKYVRRDAISDYILHRTHEQYGQSVTKEDIFYYVYGFLHSPAYRETFANDLKKMLPRLPLVADAEDFWAFSRAGRALAELHLHYEQVPPCPSVRVTGAEAGHFRVQKMRFPKKDEKSTIHYNSHITLHDIPLEAYDYVVNGKSAIEWIMERYQVTTHKESQITNDPNDWAEEVGNPRYILDLLLSIIEVSLQTRAIVNGLPQVDFGGEGNGEG